MEIIIKIYIAYVVLNQNVDLKPEPVWLVIIQCQLELHCRQRNSNCTGHKIKSTENVCGELKVIKELEHRMYDNKYKGSVGNWKGKYIDIRETSS